jgi:hypothetical protein
LEMRSMDVRLSPTDFVSKWKNVLGNKKKCDIGWPIDGANSNKIISKPIVFS